MPTPPKLGEGKGGYGGWSVRLSPCLHAESYEVTIYRLKDGVNYVAEPLTFTEAAPVKPEPSMVIPHGDLGLGQAMLDCLWQAGYRPLEGESVGTDNPKLAAANAKVEAQEKEIEWLRGLVTSLTDGTAKPGPPKTGKKPSEFVTEAKIDPPLELTTHQVEVKALPKGPVVAKKPVLSFNKKHVLGG